MTDQTAHALEDACELLQDLYQHLDRYNDPGKLLSHLTASRIDVPAADQGDLRALYMIHAAAHSDGIQAARAAVQAIEREIALEAEGDG